MKKQRHIQIHILRSLVGLTCGTLLAVILVFNLSVRGYIRSRVAAQLETVSKSASETWQDSMRERKGMGRFDEHKDRITGTRGSAIILDEDGTLLSAPPGDEEVGRELAAYFSEQDLRGEIKNRTVTLDSGTYAVSVLKDSSEDGRSLLVYVDMTALTAFTRQVNLMLVLIVLGAILLSLVLSRRIARSFARPVQSLSEFAEEIGSGKLETREMQFEDAEFTSLADSMNRMVNDLNEVKQRQEVFFQNVSHELRTPLTSIRGNAEGIVCGLMEPKNAGKVILSESDKLGGMVEELLYLSRMGKTVPEGTAEPLDLREVLSLCVSEQRAEAESRRIDFSYAFDEDPVLFPIREQDAQQLFGNLISNALRYAKSSILLTCRREDSSVFISVADDGPGIAPEDLPHVFERFYKGAGGRHGIGLSIAQSVTEAYHGSICVRNSGGAVFEVRFPTE
ncbi:MAG: HAMP domain-containing sensor histidine kinase [Candidatus Limivicinus sp.]|jgi:signal transduction histidine kinase